ncbi:MAG: glycosyltransferase [Bacteroidales bacterium]|nr:glycosyltransferase [Bacteroidales bacterium]
MRTPDINSNKLVSVIIATYNSSAFVIETLDSISNQTWDELELIITDDCSKDDSVDICRNWITNNKQRFVSAELISSEINTGVAANLNRALKIARGNWIKILGADDTLKPDCIDVNMKWVKANPDARVVFSKIDIYRNTFEPGNIIITTPGDVYSKRSILAPGRTAGSQYRMLLVHDRIHFSPSVFLHRETLIETGGFDEQFKLLEDYPLWLNLTRNGHRLHFIDKVTVNYRRHEHAINNNNNDQVINPNYFRAEDFRRVYTYPYLPADIRLNQKYIWYMSQPFRLRWLNKNRKFNWLVYSLATVYLNPFRYYLWVKKRICKTGKNDEFYA